MIKGHSKYILDFLYDDLFFVKKRSILPDTRLYNQATKQKNFEKSQLYEIPNVFKIVHNSKITYFTMSYVNANNFIEFFNTISLYDLDKFVNNIIQIIEEFINKSTLTNLNSKLINEKYLQTKNNILKIGVDLDFKNIDKIFEKEYSFTIPIGVCHGDFTFSNMLFDNDTIYLIDFLDSFLESPLLDIVKIRQDTKFNWSSEMYDNYFDKVKLEIILSFIDKKIDTYFAKYSFYKEHYKIFEVLNLLRVLQYATDKKIIEKLKKDIECEI